MKSGWTLILHSWNRIDVSSSNIVCLSLANASIQNIL